jgi:AraC-like DNA-binding protein
MEPDGFDLKLAVECSDSYSHSTGLGCTVLGASGEVFHEVGYCCTRCAVCGRSGTDMRDCARGTGEAERSGGKHVYLCPMGLNLLVSPIAGLREAAAKITAGPFRTVGLDDYIAYDLKSLLGIGPDKAEEFLPSLLEIPYVEPGRAGSLSTLLFMAVGFINNVSDAGRMLDSRTSDYFRRLANGYVAETDDGRVRGAPPQYPYGTERELLASVADSDRPKARKLLGELTEHMFSEPGGDFSRIRARAYEFVAVLSRTAADAWASPDHAFRLSHGFFKKTQDTEDINALRLSLTKLAGQFIDGASASPDVKYVNVIHKALRYMRQNCGGRVCLGDVAREAGLSPSHFSRVFKKETGRNFNAYMNTLRIEKGMALMRDGDRTLVDIADAVGFEDRSYFTKVFKRVTGVSPRLFLKTGERLRG